MTSILSAEIADYRHAELMAEAEMLRRARLARAGRRAASVTVADATTDRRQQTTTVSRGRHPLGALRSWILAGQL